MPLSPFDRMDWHLLIAAAVKIVVFVFLMTLPLVAMSVWAERRVSAAIQDRVGPNRVGPFGLLQAVADGIKFLLKEDFTPAHVRKFYFWLAPALTMVPALLTSAVLPFGSRLFGEKMVIADLDVGPLYVFAIASLTVYGIVLAGWASNSKYPFLGGVRSTSQMISYEIPMGLALLAALLVYGTFRTDSIIQQQVDSGWLIFSQPLVAVIFFITGLAEANRAPFDNAEAEQELVGGYHTEYSSMRFALFFLAEYSHLFTSAAFFSLIFLGGYFIPGVTLTDPASTTPLAVLVKLLAFMSKVVVIVFLGMVVRWSIPRLRYDQVMMVAWQGLIPLSLGLVLVNSVLVYFNMATLVPLLLGNVALAVVTLAFAPLLKQSTVNRRIPLYGSRFSPMPGEAVQTAPTHPMARADG